MKRASSGFTLVELMIVVVVVGILAAIALPNFAQLRLRAHEGATRTNMHTLQLHAEDYAVQNEATYSAVIDATHIADRLPLNFKNPYTGLQGSGVAWEDRAVFAAPATATRGLVSYADSATMLYNVKGYGSTAAIPLVLTSGQ